MLPTSLLDVFMPDDLCARCAVEEASSRCTILATRVVDGREETARLAFCGPDCKTAFVVGHNSIVKFPVG